MTTHPGGYCLRSNALTWDAEQLWRTYMMLTDLEAVFRSFKTELGLRPIFHHPKECCHGHLFITVLAADLGGIRVAWHFAFSGELAGFGGDGPIYLRMAQVFGWMDSASVAVPWL